MRWTIGKVAVTKVVELEMTGGSRFLLPQATRRRYGKFTGSRRISPTRPGSSA